MCSGHVLGWVLLLSMTAVPGQSPIAATLQANQPLVAAWWNAPVGTPGALAVHPAGPLPSAGHTFANVETPPFFPSVPGVPDLPRSRASTDLVQHFEPLWRVQAFLAPGPGENVGAFADVTMHLTAPPGTFASIRIEAGSGLPTNPAPTQVIQVDVDADGANDIDWVGLGGGPTGEFRLLNRTLGPTPLPIRVRVLAQSIGSPAALGVLIVVRPWAPGTSPAGNGCDVLASASTSAGGVWTTNAGLAPYLPAVPTGSLDLHAHGVGDIAGCLVSDQPTVAAPLSMPPYASSCGALSSVLGLFPLSAVQPNHWRLAVPLLPPGLVFYVQHWSATTQAPFHFGTSNRIRVQT